MRPLSLENRLLVDGERVLTIAQIGDECPCCGGAPPPSGECCDRVCDPPGGSGTCGLVSQLDQFGNPIDPSIQRYGYARFLRNEAWAATKIIRGRVLRTIFGPPPGCQAWQYTQFATSGTQTEQGEANNRTTTCRVPISIPVVGSFSAETVVALGPNICANGSCDPGTVVERSFEPLAYCLPTNVFCWSIVPGCDQLFGGPRDTEVTDNPRFTIRLDSILGPFTRRTTERVQILPDLATFTQVVQTTNTPPPPTITRETFVCGVVFDPNGQIPGNPPFGIYEIELETRADDVRATHTIRTELELRHNWSHACSNEPTGFVPPNPIPNPCDNGGPPPPPPPPTRYIKGKPCPGNQPAPTVVTDAREVLACGTVNVGGYCYTFDPRGDVVSEIPPGAIVNTAVIRGGTCCTCLAQINPRCSTTDINVRPEWLTGFRDANDQWRLTTAYSNGQCCCSPRDRFKLLRARSYVIREFNPDGTEAVADETIFEPYIFGQSVPRVDIFNGFPRDAIPNEPIEFGWTILKRNYVNGVVLPEFDQHILGRTFRENVGCEWLAGFFAAPLRDLPGLIDPGPFNPLPTAVDADAQGFVNETAINRYDVLANCDLLIARGEYARRPGRGPVADQTAWAEVQWIIERDANSPCSGGCSPPAGIPLPVSLVQSDRVFAASEIVASLGGGSGCGTCGSGGGL